MLDRWPEDRVQDGAELVEDANSDALSGDEEGTVEVSQVLEDWIDPFV